MEGGSGVGRSDAEKAAAKGGGVGRKAVTRGGGVGRKAVTRGGGVGRKRRRDQASSAAVCLCTSVPIQSFIY